MARYELKRAPKTHPGEILKEDFLAPLGLTQIELAKALKTSFRTVNEILKDVFKSDLDRINFLNPLRHINKRYNWS